MGTFVHSTAVIDDDVELGDGTRVWHFVHVSAGARIGAQCTLGQNVFIGRGVRIGRGARIQNNVSVYEGVELDDDVFVGPSCVFTNVKNPRAFVSRKHAYLQTKVGRGASLGANATIVCGVTLGQYCFVGAGAVVTRDVAPYALVVGAPAKKLGYVCRCGERLQGQGLTTCADCGERYRISAEGCEPQANP
ncbi:MAG TPA: acyltransferase [Polyangiales bacterium]|nr:acyltransferase [Polyangiales bacterium]